MLMDAHQVMWLKKNWKLAVGITVCLTLIWYFALAKSGDSETITRKKSLDAPLHSIKLSTNIKKVPFFELSESSDKWIVVTSINYPTEAIKIFAEQPGWKTVVIGDTKTPGDWSYTNVTFLSVENQRDLGYQVFDLLPFRSYARKNIGYLYAIHHGAKVIYESDDDNIPDDGLKLIAQESEVISYVPEEDRIAVNVYAHFGKPQVWPRGYPLRAIQPGVATEPEKTQKKKKLVPIQQGLANYDPDVDAIYRLTQPLKITFENSPPISIPAGMMCPWNSQNTLFYDSAFWGMLIPITTTFRVCDIWRSYWAQRILWEIGGEVVFLPPSVTQIRNAHDYLLDFEDELDLYLKSEDLIRFLKEWTSNKETLPERILDLAIAMVEKDFWKVGDARLVKAWLEDLISVGYEFPSPIS